MNPQETIYKMLAGEGDLPWHEKVKPRTWPDKTYNYNCSCGADWIWERYFNSHVESMNKEEHDLTTESGAFWLLKRLEGWDRCEEFTYWLYANILGGDLPAPNLSVAAMDAMWWLTVDVKDGKAPALFNALCEFTGVEVEG